MSMLVNQMEDLGFCAKGEAGAFIDAHSLTYDGDFPVDTGGGQLSIGEAGAGGGLMSVVEVARQIRGEAGERQIANCAREGQPFLDGWREGRLTLPRCTDCTRLFFYPRAACPHCWSDAIEWVTASGGGTVVSYSLVHRPNDESFFDEVPIVLVELALDEDVTILARVLCDPAAARSGCGSRSSPTRLRAHAIRCRCSSRPARRWNPG